MNRFVMLLIFVCLCTGANATRHFVMSDGNGFTVASDSLSTGTSDEGPVCKVVVRNKRAVILWGEMTEDYYSSSGAPPQRSYSFKPVVDKILDSNYSVDVTYQRLLEASKYSLRSRIGHRFRQRNFNLGGLLLWVENGVPKMRIFDVRLQDWDRKSFHAIPRQTVVPVPFNLYEFSPIYKDPLGPPDYVARDPLTQAPIKLTPPQDPIRRMKARLAEIAKSPAEGVGPPYSVLRLSTSGAAWLEGDVCRRENKIANLE